MPKRKTPIDILRSRINFYLDRRRQHNPDGPVEELLERVTLIDLADEAARDDLRTRVQIHLGARPVWMKPRRGDGMLKEFIVISRGAYLRMSTGEVQGSREKVQGLVGSTPASTVPGGEA
jgi:hypothetical protein